MLSIIVCTIKPTQLAMLEQNIANTIGIPYQLITWNNTTQQRGLCSVYNHCAQQAQFPYLCFVHDDVRFHTNNWGQIIVKHLNNQSVGLVGIAGSAIKSAYPSAWWFGDKSNNHLFYNILQHRDQTLQHEQMPPNQSAPVQVCTLDGVFLCCRHEVWQQHRFDEQLLKNFHNYDIDFSLQISQHLQVQVIYDVLIEHFSVGGYNSHWAESSLLLARKWKHALPMSVTPLTPEKINAFEQQCRDQWIETLISNNVHRSIIIRQTWKILMLLSPYNRYFWLLKQVLRICFPSLYQFFTRFKTK